MLRAAGIVALIVLAACGSNTTPQVASPSPVIAQGNWVQSIAFTGEVVGQMTGIVADSGDQTSSCTGQKTRNGQSWSDSFHGSINTSGLPWEVVFLISTFRGPGTYKNMDVSVVVRSPDGTKVWESLAADKVTFTIDRTQQSGTVDAGLTNATTGRAGLHLSGRWNCRG